MKTILGGCSTFPFGSTNCIRFKGYFSAQGTPKVFCKAIENVELIIPINDFKFIWMINIEIKTIKHYLFNCLKYVFLIINPN